MPARAVRRALRARLRRRRPEEAAAAGLWRAAACRPTRASPAPPATPPALSHPGAVGAGADARPVHRHVHPVRLRLHRQDLRHRPRPRAGAHQEARQHGEGGCWAGRARGPRAAVVQSAAWAERSLGRAQRHCPRAATCAPSPAPAPPCLACPAPPPPPPPPPQVLEALDNTKFMVPEPFPYQEARQLFKGAPGRGRGEEGRGGGAAVRGSSAGLQRGVHTPCPCARPCLPASHRARPAALLRARRAARRADSGAQVGRARHGWVLGWPGWGSALGGSGLALRHCRTPRHHALTPGPLLLPRLLASPPSLPACLSPQRA